MVKVVTINILFKMKDWAQRRELLLEGLAAEQPDLIALQEVKLPEDTSAWLAERLSLPYRRFGFKTPSFQDGFTQTRVKCKA